MILDGHIHMKHGPVKPGAGEKLLNQMRRSGVDGGMVISPDPAGNKETLFNRRLDALLELCGVSDRLFPCFWIDAVAENAAEQVEAAVNAGVAAFKIICGEHYPCDKRAMKTYGEIAARNKPILFHSGILWDGRYSSQYNRPGEFECLLEIKNLKFSLAHVSWPWCDESIAVLGKFLNALAIRTDISCEMFMDLTPGTPPRWRREVLEKLFLGGYDVEHSVIFGTDCNTEDYNSDWSTAWQARDNSIYEEIGIGVEAFKRRIYGGNLLRFLGLSGEKVARKLPRMGE